MQTTFEFTEDNIEKIKKLSIQLRDEEERLGDFVIDTIVSAIRLNKLIGLGKDNFEFMFSAFSSNADCNKRNKVVEGEPIYKAHFNIVADDVDDPVEVIDTHKLEPPHPLRHLYFCHCLNLLVFQSQLGWEDILLIDSVSIDVKVDFKVKLDIKYVKRPKPIFNQKKK